MLNLIKKIFKDPNQKELERLQPIVDEINGLEESIKKLTDSELKDKTTEFRKRLAAGETLDDLLPEAFAVVREAAQRSTEEGFRPYDVQLIGGIVLHEGKIAEMKTGEGKTLAATLPVYLNALTGKGVHVITVNDYLARRDSEWMGQIYRFLGLSVGVILNGMTAAERKEAYNCDITYGTNNEFGFDYLRDNMALRPEDVVQGELNYAILDEIDSILIDEARTPLIISGPVQESTRDYTKFNRIIPKLVRDQDYEMDEKNRSVHLTEEGTKRIEKALNISNIYDEEHIKLTHQLNQALKAYTLMKKDRDYIVKDGEVKIVDEFTGRVMEGRRFSEGLHQAIEAKEGVQINKESQTFASITYQNYFRMYDKLAGMTGTAETEEEEFIKIYGMEVVVIPTNEPMIRDDMPDLIFATEEQKFRAAVEEVVKLYEKGQPVLVGTVDIDKSEELSRRLKKRGVTHNVLNAKNHEREADIIKDAGQRKSVTIATNMAGRGTDIVLGEGVKGLGGLHVLGTERHESRRIDNQLRGRSGRQGDPGSSQFYVSLEDDLMRLFGSDNIKGLLGKMGMNEGEPIEHKLITRSLERAQKTVEGRNFEIRKTILEYDNIMNKQREIIYKQRREVLFADDLKDIILGMLEKVIEDVIELYISEEIHPDEWDLSGMINYFEQHNISLDCKPADLKDMSQAEIEEFLCTRAKRVYQEKEEEIGSEVMGDLVKFISLRIIDRKWMNHLDNMDELRQGIGLRAYGQKDPLTEYKFESYDMFNEMTSSIREDIIKNLFRLELRDDSPDLSRIERNNLQYQKSSEQSSGRGKRSSREQDKKRQPVVKVEKPGRNDPCPCGSGKKYKKCCGR
ncbi:preprotein translocase subunit SecA [Iocasia frigidifontis]|uniref:Protein translocase subunit SecA n=1 Tax=Iocasia fonsfrigidae TaxID=2682810 RepID=A0A8A7KC92_9FIRM|nr:preprotein translocase subunit SecA [Iocasia fonsfrigidae]QTL96999.1 preprotein translocase subunit SecA [Iocasia fonsfrigidae]